MTSLCTWFGISNTCGGLWSNVVGQNRETDKEDDEDCAEGGSVDSGKFYRDGEGGREALGIENCSIIISDSSELKLAWSKKSSSCFVNNFQIFLLFGILNRSIFKVRDVLRWAKL